VNILIKKEKDFMEKPNKNWEKELDEFDKEQRKSDLKFLYNEIPVGLDVEKAIESVKLKKLRG